MAPEIIGIYSFGDTVADANRLEIRRKGVPLELEPKAVRVLLYLVRHHGRVVTKDELMAEAWAGTFVTDNALTRVIAQIRKQLGDNARAPRYIETSATAGYRFIAEVREGESVAAVSVPVPKRRLPVAAAALMVVAAIAWWLRAPGIAPVKLAGLRQITTSPAADLWPTFSPDGSQIAFSSNRSGSFELYVRSLAPGSAERQITEDGQESIQPAWSPDGRFLAYVARRRGGIAVVPVSGGAARYLTDQGDTPAWSPDGRYLAFRASSLELNPAIETSGIPDTTIWVVGADGSGIRPATRPGSPAGGHNYPRWNPDGSRIIFSATRPWMVDPATGKLQEIRIAAGAVRWPALSPDGAHLYYVGADVQQPGLWHARIDGWRAQPPEALVPAAGATPRDLAI